MAIYEYRCAQCASTFEVRRTFGESGDAATCPAGHTGARRVLSVFATAGRARGDGPGLEDRGSPLPAGGCGAGCACAAAGR